MEEARHGDLDRLEIRLGKGRIAIVSEDDNALFVIPGKRILSGTACQVVQRRVNSRDQEEKADDEEEENFEKSVHGNREQL